MTTFEEWWVFISKVPYRSKEEIAQMAFAAGAASRDAEVVSLTGQRDRQIDTCAARENEIIALEEKLFSRDAEIAELVAALEFYASPDTKADWEQDEGSVAKATLAKVKK